MTRVNVINPMCLYDQHLIAEYREIPRIVSTVKKMLKEKTNEQILSLVTPDYVMNTGHVRFFYDKLEFIRSRHESIKREGLRRGINLLSITITLEGVPDILKKEFVPSHKDCILNLERIREKIDLKPEFYRYSKIE